MTPSEAVQSSLYFELLDAAAQKQPGRDPAALSNVDRVINVSQIVQHFEEYNHSHDRPFPAPRFPWRYGSVFLESTTKIHAVPALQGLHIIDPARKPGSDPSAASRLTMDLYLKVGGAAPRRLFTGSVLVAADGKQTLQGVNLQDTRTIPPEYAALVFTAQGFPMFWAFTLIGKPGIRIQMDESTQPRYETLLASREIVVRAIPGVM